MLEGQGNGRDKQNIIRLLPSLTLYSAGLYQGDQPLFCLCTVRKGKLSVIEDKILQSEAIKVFCSSIQCQNVLPGKQLNINNNNFCIRKVRLFPYIYSRLGLINIYLSWYRYRSKDHGWEPTVFNLLKIIPVYHMNVFNF